VFRASSVCPGIDRRQGVLQRRSRLGAGRSEHFPGREGGEPVTEPTVSGTAGGPFDESPAMVSGAVSGPGRRLVARVASRSRHPPGRRTAAVRSPQHFCDPPTRSIAAQGLAGYVTHLAIQSRRGAQARRRCLRNPFDGPALRSHSRLKRTQGKPYQPGVRPCLQAKHIRAERAHSRRNARPSAPTLRGCSAA
jgi:hypothetical protein